MDGQQRFILDQMRKHIQQRFPSIQAAFLAVDTDRSGCISLDEFATILKVNHVSVNPQDLARLAEAFDANQDGRVSYEEFCRTIESGPYIQAGASRRELRGTPGAAPAPPSPAADAAASPRLGLQLNPVALSEARAKELLTYFRKAVEQSYPSLNRAFIHIDADRSGFISAQELISCLYDHNIYPTWQELKDLVDLLDVNGDGVIDYNEFGRAMHGRVGSAASPRPPAAPAAPAAPAPASPTPARATEGVAAAVAPTPPGLAAVHRAFRKWCVLDHPNLRDAFRKVNTSWTGAVTEPELRAAVDAVARHADAATVRALFQAYDLNHDGLLQYNEFVKAMAFDTL